MIDILQGKFEFRIWVGILIVVGSLLLTLAGDQATFVHPPRNQLEIILTLLPVLEYSLIGDRASCFVTTLSIYSGLLGAGAMGTIHFLERKVFEPRFFRQMIATKLREEKLFNHYLNQLKP